MSKIDLWRMRELIKLRLYPAIGVSASVLGGWFTSYQKRTG